MFKKFKDLIPYAGHSYRCKCANLQMSGVIIAADWMLVLTNKLGSSGVYNYTAHLEDCMITDFILDPVPVPHQLILHSLPPLYTEDLAKEIYSELATLAEQIGKNYTETSVFKHIEVVGREVRYEGEMFGEIVFI
jgi:hypothetical protein